MRAYIQTLKNKEFYNVNAFVANEGFSTLGWETIKFTSLDDVDDTDPESLFVGGIGTVRQRLAQLGINSDSGEIDYPNELAGYLGRNVWTSTVEDIVKGADGWHLFIKPQDETKKFAGKVVRDYKDFVGLIDVEKETKIWCSEVVNFITEWRCFIRYGQILDIRQYKGAWDSTLNLSVIKSAVRDFKSGPAAYALDFGTDETGTMKLVEVNDGHSLGTYGLSPVNYAKFLSARWAQLTNTTDYADF